MTREEIELVLSDLCNRTKYRPVVHVEIVNDYSITIDTYDWPLLEVSYFDDKLILSPGPNWNKHRVVKLGYGNDIIKPYLRSLSSMTDEEILELYKNFGFYYLFNPYEVTDEWRTFKEIIRENKLFLPYPIWCDDLEKGYKYLEMLHFDYRGLIKRG